jgi:hypothetical protein
MSGSPPAASAFLFASSALTVGKREFATRIMVVPSRYGERRKEGFAVFFVVADFESAAGLLIRLGWRNVFLQAGFVV